MAQTNFNVRMDENLKKEFGMLCSNLGLSMTTAFCVFAKKAVAEQRIPFELTANPSPVVQKSKRIGAAKGRLNVSDDFDLWDKEVEDMFEEGGMI
ncbi:MAG: type II toxin-antitoxin system RelB/DinJ family antitoxin [Ruminococcus sp.]|nr:type II toxin-antitoxin system RelB/DinJ family antitoxin [Ruminococcus sp.]